MRMAIAAIGVAACADASRHGGDASAPPGPPIDLVLVIRDSPSMAKVQADLIANLPGFWVRLDDANLDYRIAVTTTGRDFAFDVATPFGTSHGMQTGANGMFSAPPSCGLAQPWIERGDAEPVLELACAAQVGGAGPMLEMPLGALRDALSKTNPGFHRDGALVAAVIVSDGDDCSYEHSVTLPGGQSLCQDMMEPVATYAAFLGTLGRWAVVALAAPTACTSVYGTAQPAPRLGELVTDAGPNGLLASLCDGNLSIGLDQAAALFAAAAR